MGDSLASSIWDIMSAAARRRMRVSSSVSLFTIICVIRYVFEDGINFWGGSEAIAPSGEVTDRGRLLEEDFVLAKVDEGALRRERIFSPMMRDENLGVTVKELKRIDRERTY